MNKTVKRIYEGEEKLLNLRQEIITNEDGSEIVINYNPNPNAEEIMRQVEAATANPEELLSNEPIMEPTPIVEAEAVVRDVETLVVTPEEMAEIQASVTPEAIVEGEKLSDEEKAQIVENAVEVVVE